MIVNDNTIISEPWTYRDSWGIELLVTRSSSCPTKHFWPKPICADLVEVYHSVEMHPGIFEELDARNSSAFQEVDKKWCCRRWELLVIDFGKWLMVLWNWDDLAITQMMTYGKSRALSRIFQSQHQTTLQPCEKVSGFIYRSFKWSHTSQKLKPLRQGNWKPRLNAWSSGCVWGSGPITDRYSISAARALCEFSSRSRKQAT